MTPAGHAIFAYVASDGRRGDWRAPFVLAAGSMIPDLVDKSLLVLGVFPWGRTIGHSLVVWFFAFALVHLYDGAARPVPAARWVVWGWATHLLADFIDDLSAGFESSAYAFSAWFGFPWTNPDMYPWIVSPGFPPERAVSAFEIGCFGLFAGWLWWKRNSRTLRR